MSTYLRAALTIYWKDVTVEARTKETVLGVLVFALVVTFIFKFTFDPAPQVVALIGPGIAWVAYVFAGIVGMGRTFVLERERGTLEALLLAPVPREAIYLGKLAGAFTLMIVVETAMLPVFVVLHDLSFLSLPFAATAVLATLGLAAVGTLFSAIAVHTRARELLLPLLFLPVTLPIIIAAVSSTSLLLDGGGWRDVGEWLRLMLAFDIAFLVLSSWAFEFVLEE
ncbi:MAG: heme exporter protein CcmB [Chloroflexi bacterium]|nr:heme exporter protein CcmB [Chloroflexota bacterium]